MRNLLWRAVLLAAVLAPGLARGQTLPPNPAAAGLWIGEARLIFINHLATGNLEFTPSAAQMRLILHADAAGKVRLLKDVMIARKLPSAGDEVALVTDPARLATLPLATELVATRIAGQRFSTVGYDFTDNDATPADYALDLTGGLGEGFECQGTLLLPKDHVTNPFRHKYHPDHANEGAKAYEITRKLRLHSFVAAGDLNGTTQIQCAYEEKISGLHKAELVVQGNVVLRRVSTTPVLNQ